MDIVKEIGMPAALGQLAEEAAELAQAAGDCKEALLIQMLDKLQRDAAGFGKAALKLQRVIMGVNPTPVTLEQAKANLIEEAIDVDLCLTMIEEEDPSICYDQNIFLEKQLRWENRIREAKGEQGDA